MFSSVRKFRSNQGLHVGLTLSAPVWNKINNASIACLCSVPFPPCGRPNFSLFLLSHCHYVWQCILIISLPDMSLKMPYKWTLQLAPGTKFLNSRAPCARGCTLNIAMTSEIKEDFVQEYQYKLDSYLTMYGVTPRNILIDWLIDSRVQSYSDNIHIFPFIATDVPVQFNPFHEIQVEKPEDDDWSMYFNNANFHVKESLHLRIRIINIGHHYMSFAITTEFSRYDTTYEGNWQCTVIFW